MQQYHIPHTNLTVSRLAYGCMNIGGGWDRSPLTETDKQAAIEVVLAAYEAGITLFDHADIYAHGKSEAVFAEVWSASPGLRDKIILQSKCGIRFRDDPRPGDPQRYDFSYDHIIASVEGTLRRLQTEYLDILLLHRPDALMEPEEVARAFEVLHSSGKVRYFGVSNHNAYQIELLRRFVDQLLVINQVELSLLHNHLFNEGIMTNQTDAPSGLAGGILEYCRLNDMLIQAWSPIAGGQLFNPSSEAPAPVQETARLVAQLAADKETSREAIMLAWLLRHPAPIQPVIGTTKAERVRRSCQADAVTLSREEWYALFTTARGAAVP